MDEQTAIKLADHKMTIQLNLYCPLARESCKAECIFFDEFEPMDASIYSSAPPPKQSNQWKVIGRGCLIEVLISKLIENLPNI